MSAMLSLRITLEGGGITKTIQFSPQTTVFDACKIISDKFAEAVQGKRKFSEKLFKFPLILNKKQTNILFSNSK